AGWRGRLRGRGDGAPEWVVDGYGRTPADPADRHGSPALVDRGPKDRRHQQIGHDEFTEEHSARRRPRRREWNPEVRGRDRFDREDRAAEARCGRRAEELRDDIRPGEPRRDAPGDEKARGDRRVEVRPRFAAEDVDGDRQRETVRERDAEQPRRPADRRGVAENGADARKTEGERAQELGQAWAEGLHR